MINPSELAVYTTRGAMLVFVVAAQNRDWWVRNLAALPVDGAAETKV
jgi:hypothetical protein